MELPETKSVGFTVLFSSNTLDSVQASAVQHTLWERWLLPWEPAFVAENEGQFLENKEKGEKHTKARDSIVPGGVGA